MALGEGLPLEGRGCRVSGGEGDGGVTEQKLTRKGKRARRREKILTKKCRTMTSKGRGLARCSSLASLGPALLKKLLPIKPIPTPGVNSL